MEVVATIWELREKLAKHRRDSSTIGFVPTMGALHAGHRSLIEQSAANNDVTVVSVFVNPLQFGPSEDFQKYPRNLDADSTAARQAGANYVFAPEVEEMYPTWPLSTSIHIDELTDVLEGLSRPGHFDGVATVVAKLFNIVQPDRAYFGEKDWQQLMVVKRMVADLSLPVEIVGCPIVRDIDGLALSSRNVYLSGEEREAALVIPKALAAAVEQIKNANRSPLDVVTTMTDVLAEEPLVNTEYATVVGSDMHMPAVINKHCRLLIAAKVGTTRLLDNRAVMDGES